MARLWPFNFQQTGSVSDLRPSDLYELIIRAVAEGNIEASRDARTRGAGNAADAVRAGHESQTRDVLNG